MPKYYKCKHEGVTHAFRKTSSLISERPGSWSILLVTSLHPFDETWIGNVYKTDDGKWDGCMRKFRFPHREEYFMHDESMLEHPTIVSAARSMVKHYLENPSENLPK